jgi:hypothetical protein
MNQETDKPTDSSSALTTPVELAQLAVAIAHWKNRTEPAFAEAEDIIERACRHLSGDRQVENSPRGYYQELARLGVNTSQIASQNATPMSPEAAEIVQTLMNGKSHLKVVEPRTFPISLISCLTLITGEKDRRRRAPWLAKAGVTEKRVKIADVYLYRILAAKIVPHLARFGAVYQKRKPVSSPRDMSGKFTKARIQRDARGRIKSITDRDERGRILKGRA